LAQRLRCAARTLADGEVEVALSLDLGAVLVQQIGMGLACPPGIQIFRLE
jgi:hypothetical protein